VTSLFVMVGDLSADKHTAHVIANLKKAVPDMKFWGVGGPNLVEQGVECLFDCQTFSVIGIFGTIKYLPYIAKVRQTVLDEIEKRKPDALLFADFGAVNLRLCKELRKRYPQLPIIYFISPQVWGSRPWRIKTVDKTVTKMLVIYPFEETLYKRRGVDAMFVGNPLTIDLPKPESLTNRSQFCQLRGLNEADPIIGIFPGSRKQEISAHMPVLADAIRWLLSERPNCQFVIAAAKPMIKDAIDASIEKYKLTDLVGKRLFLAEPGENYDLMANADILWAKSGTTTLESALFGKPMLIYYRGDWPSYLILLAFKTIKRIGWPNMLAGKGLVPELIMLDCRPEKLVKYTLDWLGVPAFREKLSQELQSLRSELGRGNFAENATKQILSILKLDSQAALGGTRQ
jgi:lipid-A-disaccharide synthase